MAYLPGKVTQGVSGRPGIWTQVNHCASPSCHQVSQGKSQDMEDKAGKPSTLF